MARHRLQRMFALEKLKVYDKALSSAASLAQYSGGWDKRHAVSDHLLRASESIVLNLAEAARLRSAAKREHLSLDFMRWFHALPGAPELSSRLLRQVDKAGTSVVLNIAEGNGRYAPGDRRSLFDIAEASVVKAGAYLELCARSGEMESDQKGCAMDLLGRIASMLRGLAS